MHGEADGERNETEAPRIDRNWIELLQELRIVLRVATPLRRFVACDLAEVFHTPHLRQRAARFVVSNARVRLNFRSGDDKFLWGPVGPVRVPHSCATR